VAILASNCVEYLDLWFACGKLGAILQTLNWRLAPAELDALTTAGFTAVGLGPRVLRAETAPAIAVALDLTLVTHNRGEFERVPGLRLAEWKA